jgi:hypothetical protein
MRRHGEFDPDPRTVRLPQEAAIARVSTPSGFQAGLDTKHADVEEMLPGSQRFSNVIPPGRSRRAGASPDSDLQASRPARRTSCWPAAD